MEQNVTELLSKIGGPRTVIIVAVVLVALWLVSKLFATKEESTHTKAVRCGNCGWQGQASKFKPRCAKCGQAIAG